MISISGKLLTEGILIRYALDNFIANVTYGLHLIDGFHLRAIGKLIKATRQC